MSTPDSTNAPASSATSAKDRYVAFAFSRADILIEIMVDGTITFITGAVQAMLNANSTDLVGASIDRLVAPDDQDALAAILRSARASARLAPTRLTLQAGTRRITGDIAGCPLTRATGHYFLTFAMAMPTAAAAPTALAGTAAEFRDRATGLLNKTGLTNLAQHYLATSLPGRPAKQLTFLDVTGSEASSGAVGRKVADTLRALSVGSDSVGVVAPNRFGVVHDAAVDQTTIRAKVSEALKTAAPNAKVVAETVGLEAGKMNETDAMKALVYAINRFADESSTEHKGDRTAATLDELVQSSFAKITEIRNIFERGRFDLVYQPIIDLKTMRIHHQEALTRLKDGSSPFATVVFAEEVGLIADLDLEVASRALQSLSENPSTLDIAINLSGRSLDSMAFVESLYALLERHRNHRRRLIIEITESSRIRDLTQVAGVIGELQKAGHKICLDDFGSGSAAFHYLRALPVDTIKIDGLYVREIEKRSRDRAFVGAICALAKQLGCQTVAEMVERKEHAELLASLGVDFGQGWLFAKARPDPYTRDSAAPEKWVGDAANFGNRAATKR